MLCWPKYLPVYLCVCISPSIFTYLTLLVLRIMFPLAPAPFITFTLWHSPRPAWHSDDVDVWRPADHLCLLHFAVLSIHSLRERWRDGGREELCATKIPGYVTSEHALADCGSTLHRITSQLYSHVVKMQTLRPRLPARTSALSFFVIVEIFSLLGLVTLPCSVFYELWFQCVYHIDVGGFGRVFFSFRRCYLFEARLAFYA